MYKYIKSYNKVINKNSKLDNLMIDYIRVH